MTAKAIKLKVNYKDIIEFIVDSGLARSIGSAFVSITVNSITYQFKLHVMKGFKFNILLGFPSLSDLNLTINCKRRIAYSPNGAEVYQTIGSCKKTEVPDKPDPSVPEAKSGVDTILERYDSLFAKDDTYLGRIDIEKHRIQRKTDIPIAQTPYRQLAVKLTEISRQVKEQLKRWFNTRITLTVQCTCHSI